MEWIVIDRIRSFLLFCLWVALLPAALAQQAGTLDPAWTPTPVPDTNLSSMALQPDGRVVVSGNSLPSATGHPVTARFAADGTLDPTFGTNGVVHQLDGASAVAVDTAVDAGGRIYVAGRVAWGSEGHQEWFVARMLGDGQADPSFGTDGVARFRVIPSGQLYDIGHMLALQPDGKIVLAGYALTSGTGILIGRLLPDGSVDTAFGANGRTILPFDSIGTVGMMRLAGDGSILVGGVTGTDHHGFLTRLRADGQLDTSFAQNGTARGSGTSSVLDAAVQPDGKILVTGWFVDHAGPSPSVALVLMRLHPDGSPDTSFSGDGTVVYNPSLESDFGQTLRLDPFGRILVAATLNVSETATFLHDANAAVLRFMANGTRDPFFGTEGPQALELPQGTFTLDLEIDPTGTRPGYLLQNEDPQNPSADARTVLKFFTRDAPVVSLGFGYTFADSDGVPGEVVSLSGNVYDPDGVIASTTWTVDGNVVASGMGATVELPDGVHSVALAATDDEGLTGNAAVSYQVLAPLTPLPRSGSTSTEGSSSSEFGVSIRDAANLPVSTASTQDTLRILGLVFPQAADANTTGDVFVVVQTESGWFMRTTAGSFVHWNTRVADLVPAYENITLANPLRVQVHTGTLPGAGTYRVHVGYRRDGQDALVYASSAVELAITDP